VDGGLRLPSRRLVSRLSFERRGVGGEKQRDRGHLLGLRPMWLQRKVGCMRARPFWSMSPTWSTMPVTVGPGTIAVQRMPSFA